MSSNTQEFTSRDIELMIEEVKSKVGTDTVICGLSGGVDSAVVAALIAQAIGSQLHCILVDHGLMRKNEIPQVAQRFKEQFPSINLHVSNAEDLFLSKLKGVIEPQVKRKIIGSTFIDIFSSEASKIKNAKFLAQGTIYPDVVESGGTASAPSSTIKLHHNVGGLPDNLEFKLIEPLRKFYKDDVRRLGSKLGLPQDMVMRHPFPGPGLAVRCLGEVNKTKLDILRNADQIAVDEIRKADLYDKTSQAFAVLLPVKSVGVSADERTYENTIAIRCVTTNDFMTAEWTRIPYEVLDRISNRIINEVNGVNRVVYDISSKPPATIEWE